MPADLSALLADLGAEQGDLDRIVAPLDAPAWDTPTPAEGWSVRDQVVHLWFFDTRATLALRDPRRFSDELAAVVADPREHMEAPLRAGRTLPAGTVLARWRDGRAALGEALEAAPAGARVPWYGPPMSVASFASARLMECWAHGQDVVDALRAERTPTARLRHVAHLAVRARPFNYASHGLTLPEREVRVVLEAPGGEQWTWNGGGDGLVAGTALDFCLVATQRRHLEDTELRVEGRHAAEWMTIIQAFAGPPGPGRRPGQFRRERPCRPGGHAPP